MVIIQSANLGLRFLLELCALAALGYWGFQTGKGPFLKALLGIGAPLLVAVLWGTFGSPKAAIPLTGALHAVLELVIFGSPALALYAAGRPSLAGLFAAVVMINRLLMILWGQ